MKLIPTNAQRPGAPATIRQIHDATCKHYGITLEDLLRPTRARPYPGRRHVAMFVAHVDHGKSFPQIARQFGLKDHTTVLHGVRMVGAALRLGRSEMAAAVAGIRSQLRDA